MLLSAMKNFKNLGAFKFIGNNYKCRKFNHNKSMKFTKLGNSQHSCLIPSKRLLCNIPIKSSSDLKVHHLPPFPIRVSLIGYEIN